MIKRLFGVRKQHCHQCHEVVDNGPAARFCSRACEAGWVYDHAHTHR